MEAVGHPGMSIFLLLPIQGVYYSPLCTGSIIYRMGRRPESDKHAHASGIFTFGKLNVGCLLDRAYGMQSD